MDSCRLSTAIACPHREKGAHAYADLDMNGVRPHYARNERAKSPYLTVMKTLLDLVGWQGVQTRRQLEWDTPHVKWAGTSREKYRLQLSDISQIHPASSAVHSSAFTCFLQLLANLRHF